MEELKVKVFLDTLDYNSLKLLGDLISLDQPIDFVESLFYYTSERLEEAEKNLQTTL